MFRLVLEGLGDGPIGPWDAIVLDVDNGPDFLIHRTIAPLYTEAGLRAAYAQLAPAARSPSGARVRLRPCETLLERIGVHPWTEHIIDVYPRQAEFRVCDLHRVARPEDLGVG